MKEPIILRRHDCINHEEALFWKDLLYRTIKIGTELEIALPKGKVKKEFLPSLIEKMSPSKDLDLIEGYGLFDIVSEHCGLEFQVIGRRPYYNTLRSQYQNITKELISRGVRVPATCGLHYHIIAHGLAVRMPEIILANLWNLTRRYAPELKFITSGGNKPYALCRRRNYNSHLEMVRHSPAVNSMQEIQQSLRESRRVPEHHNFLNLEHIEFDQKGAIKTFHYEYRFPDMDLAPTSIVAKAFLFLALLFKAVEISQHGLIHVGRLSEWKKKKELINLLNNNDGNLATSDTSKITPEVMNELRSGCHEMLDLIKPCFYRLGNNSSFEVLKYLADTPISQMRISRWSWDFIEEMLSLLTQKDISIKDDIDRKIIRCIELGEVEKMATLEKWKEAVAIKLDISLDDLELRLLRLEKIRGLIWDDDLGSIIFKI